MPLLNYLPYQEKQESMLNKYLPQSERNTLGGKLTLRKVWDALVGSRVEDQIAGFAQPMAMGMYVKPKWGETGSFSGLWDKKPRVEISDEMMRFKKPLERKVYQAVPLDELIEHPLLFERHPEMKKWRTTIDYTRESAKPWSEGSFNAQQIKFPNSSRAIYEVTGSSEPNILKSLAHELQHGVQHQSGFSTGGSPQEFTKRPSQLSAYIDELNRMLNKNDTQLKIEGINRNELLKHYESAINELFSLDQPYEAYRKIAGEIEARDTANRMLMNTEQRRKRMPLASQGIALKDMIVRY